MAECRVSPGKTHVLIGDPVFGQIRPELMYPHKAQQKISISGLTVDDLLHWLQNVPKCRDVQLLVVHVGVNTCWVNTVTESMWRALLKLLKSVFPNAVVQLSSVILWLVRSTSTHSPQVGRATAAVQLWSSPATWTSVYIRAHSPPFLQHTASQHRPAPPSHQLLGGGGGCSGDTCVTQACSVCPAVCFNGSLFLYTPDWCVLVA